MEKLNSSQLEQVSGGKTKVTYTYKVKRRRPVFGIETRLRE